MAYRTNQYEGMSPGRLVLALLNGALTAISDAQAATVAGRIAEKGERISKALAIIEELMAALDAERGGEIAENLLLVYTEAFSGLIKANLDSDTEKMEAAYKLIAEIRDGWAAMLEATETQPAEKQAAASGGTYL